MDYNAFHKKYIFKLKLIFKIWGDIIIYAIKYFILKKLSLQLLLIHNLKNNMNKLHILTMMIIQYFIT